MKFWKEHSRDPKRMLLRSNADTSMMRKGGKSRLELVEPPTILKAPVIIKSKER